MGGLNILPVIRHIAHDPRPQLTGKVHMKPRLDTGAIAQIFICPDGTFVFDRKAIAALRLHDAHSISVCYSSASGGFFVRPLKANGCDRGVPLERKGNRIIAHGAADFLEGHRVLPDRATKYEAECCADLHTIVIRNVAVTKARRTT